MGCQCQLYTDGFLLLFSLNALRYSFEEAIKNSEGSGLQPLITKIGLASIAEDTGDVNDILRAVDAACYAAKENGRNRIHIYHKKDEGLAKRQGEMQWIARINQAAEKNRLFLALQSIVPINGNEDDRISYEVLLRMREKDGSIILPDDFLGAAERYSLSTKVDRWVISKIFKWHADNQKKLKNISLLNINLSGKSLADEDFLNFALAELERYQIQPEKICFEITETVVITNLPNASHFMHVFKQLGCIFTLDDFGAGLSSFEYLKTLPVEYLKISGLFVKDIVDDFIDFAMVKSINEIGQVMGKKTIAESVETEEILACVRKLGVNYAQGFVISKPVALDDLKFT